MHLTLTSNKKVLDFYQSRLTFEIHEEPGEVGMVTKAEIMIALPVFLTDVSNVHCNLGSFDDVQLTALAIGSEDNEVIYKLSTYNFALNETGINENLQINQRKYNEAGE